MASNWEAHFSKGTTALRPAANTLPKGAIYWSTDDHKFFVGAGVANTWADFTVALALASEDALKAPLAGATFTGDIIVPDEAYDATAWNGSMEAPTKNAVRDKIEALTLGSTPGRVLITETNIAVATGTVSFTSIAGTWRDLEVVARGRSDRAVTLTGVLLRFNADSGSNYDSQHVQGNGTIAQAAQAFGGTSLAIGYMTGTSATANFPAVCTARIFDYRGTTFQKMILADANLRTAASAGNMYVEKRSGAWRSTAAITQVDVICDTGNFIAGSVVSLYGLL